MNLVIAALTCLYSRLLLLYPGKFRDEFAEEMQVVFRDSVSETSRDGILPLAILCLRELGGLPFNVLREFWHEFQRKDADMIAGEKVNTGSDIYKGASRQDAIAGTLPFALFGLLCIFTSTELPFHAAYPYVAFTAIVLLGLLIGLAKGFPGWAYAYLGWSLFMSFWWMMMVPGSLSDLYSPVASNELAGWRSWLPFLLLFGLALLFPFAFGLALLWGRSLRPLRQLVRGIWQNWTFLSLMMYTFAAFTQLIYDENHHPYLFAFMIGSTLAISIGAWMFLRSRSTWKRVASLLSGFLAASVIGTICYATWDWAAYYGLPEGPPEAWYLSAMRTTMMYLLWIATLFWPVIVGLARRTTQHQRLV